MSIARYWMKVRGKNDEWRHKDADIIAKLEGKRGMWQAIIIDNEFNHFNMNVEGPRYIPTRKMLRTRMEQIGRKIKLIPAIDY